MSSKQNGNNGTGPKAQAPRRRRGEYAVPDMTPEQIALAEQVLDQLAEEWGTAETDEDRAAAAAEAERARPPEPRDAGGER